MQCEILLRYLSFMQNMLLCDKLRLQDVPFSIRSKNDCIYITALGISRHFSQERYEEDLHTLKNDIKFISKSKKTHMEHIYQSSLDFTPNKLYCLERI